MPLLDKIKTLEEEAAAFGFKWDTTTQIMRQIRSECAEIEAHLQSCSTKNRQALGEEIGDLLHAVFSLCVFCEFSPRTTLEQAITKFEKRLDAVKLISQEKQLDHLKNASFEERMRIWDEAKMRVG